MSSGNIPVPKEVIIISTNGSTAWQAIFFNRFDEVLYSPKEQLFFKFWIVNTTYVDVVGFTKIYEFTNLFETFDNITSVDEFIWIKTTILMIEAYLDLT